MVGPWRILATAVQANSWILHTLVDVYAGISRRRQCIAIVAFALEGSVHVNAMSVGAHACVLAFVMIGAVSALAGNDEAGRAVAGEAAGVVATDSALAVIQLTLVHVLASTAGLPREARIALALVTLLGVDALPVAADVRP